MIQPFLSFIIEYAIKKLPQKNKFTNDVRLYGIKYIRFFIKIPIGKLIEKIRPFLLISIYRIYSINIFLYKFGQTAVGDIEPVQSGSKCQKMHSVINALTFNMGLVTLKITLKKLIIIHFCFIRTAKDGIGDKQDKGKSEGAA